MSDKTNDTAKRLMEIAKEKELMLSQEQAQAYVKRLELSSGELSDDELDNVSGGACTAEPRESEKGLTCPSCGGNLSWDYPEDDIGWTTAKCKKCKKLYAYMPYGFVEVKLD